MNNHAQWIQSGERVDDLQCHGLHLIQDPECFCFGVDAVLLSHFTRLKKGDQVVDLGTGTGIVPILLAGRNPHCRFTGVEIQETMADRAWRSVQMNGLQDRITIIHEDLRSIQSRLPAAEFQVVTSNPPYLPAGSIVNPREEKAIARHEISLKLEDLMKQASYLLQPGGRFYLIHRPQRLADIMVLGRAYKLEPKWMQMVHAYAHKPPTMVLLQLSKNGRPELKMHPPMVIYNADGTYTPELLKCYGKE